MYPIVFLIFVFDIICVTNSDYKVEVKLSGGYGTVVGVRTETWLKQRLYYAFYGVQYGKAPTRKFRFKDPREYKTGKRYYDAIKKQTMCCSQLHVSSLNATFGVENCLLMNIYTPVLHYEQKNINDTKAVVVFFHGYGHTSSLSHIYGPDFFIENGVIFISVTYRIGAFGFLKYNATDQHANMGLKDIVLSLRWIRHNVRRFGGNRKRVTVMGSHSAATLLSLLLMTKAKNLFSKMILHSGSLFSPSLFQGDPHEEREKLLKRLSKITDKDISEATPQEITTASQRIYETKEVINTQRPRVPFTPIVEEISNQSLITERPEHFYKENKHLEIKKPILIGFSTQEGLTEMIPFLHNPLLLRNYQSYFKFLVPFSTGCSYKYTTNKYQEIAKKIKDYYFKEEISEKSIDQFLKYIRDIHIYPIYKFIQSQLPAGNKMFVYKFNYFGRFNAIKINALGKSNVNVKGAASGDELCYIMKCEPFMESYRSIRNATEDRDRELITEMSAMWANFAKTGNPTPRSYTGSPTWPPMIKDQENILYIGREKVIIGTKVEKPMFEFWNQIYNNYYSDEKCNVKEEL